jgi:hypothetical protein
VSVKVTCGRCGAMVRVEFEELIPLLERIYGRQPAVAIRQITLS